MSIEIGSKWVKDGEVVKVKDIFSVSSYGKNHIFYCFDMIVLNDSFIAKSDFLEQYKPYEVVYEWQVVFELDKKGYGLPNKFIYPSSDKEYFTKLEAMEKVKNSGNFICYFLLYFTKRERKQ